MTMYVRPVEMKDIDALVALAKKAGPGVTSLQPDRTMLRNRIKRSMDTFAGLLSLADQGYLFVLMNSESDEIVGLSGIEVALGLKEPWYNFRIESLGTASVSDVQRKTTELLYLSNDHTGCSELCTLFLDPAWRHSKNGQLLSKSRFLFIAAFRDLFAKKIVAEMRGISDESGNSPFWDAVGRHFFKMDFKQADYLTGIGEKTFIAELMPRFPIYTALLPGDARVVIGQVHSQTKPARAMLEAEGLRFNGYIDIFDGGATLDAPLSELRVMKESRICHICVIPERRPDNEIWYLVSNVNKKAFRAILIRTTLINNGELFMTDEECSALLVNTNEYVMVFPLYAGV